MSHREFVYGNVLGGTTGPRQHALGFRPPSWEPGTSSRPVFTYAMVAPAPVNHGESRIVSSQSIFCTARSVRSAGSTLNDDLLSEWPPRKTHKTNEIRTALYVRNKLLA